jgi:hypothetical protein
MKMNFEGELRRSFELRRQQDERWSSEIVWKTTRSPPNSNPFPTFLPGNLKT